jgi:exosortase H (IPTLxxWG-CTERM-specific)
MNMRKYVLVFVCLQLFLYVVTRHLWIEREFVLPWTTSLASFCSILVTNFDPNVVAFGKVMQNQVNGFSVSIEPGCNGVEAYIILLAAIVAFPAPWVHRVWGVVMGFVAVQGLNVVRVISLFYLGQWNQQAFDFAHTYLWQALIMLDVLVFWLYWVKVSTRNTKPSALAIPASERAI